MYGPPSDCKEKAKGEKTSLRKCIRPLVEPSAPGQDELRAYLSLLVGRLLSTIFGHQVPRHAVVTVLSSLLFLCRPRWVNFKPSS